MASEFDIIRRFFDRPARSATLGVGDDCALMRVTTGMELAVSTDMLVEGRHFFADADPRKLGYKALAVNLSDMAAMGATPRWATLAIALPRADEHWLSEFSTGLFDLADIHRVDIVGGDTTRGPLNICITIFGEVPPNAALRRDGAKAGDSIWVSGALGDAALGLAHLQGCINLDDIARTLCLERLYQPVPRVALGIALRGIASAAIDISDGLVGDLGHICECSGVSAELYFKSLPRSGTLAECIDTSLAQHCLLAGGDDYELCFTAPQSMNANIERIAGELALPLSCIGRVLPLAEIPVSLLDEARNSMTIATSGFDHFSRP